VDCGEYRQAAASKSEIKQTALAHSAGEPPGRILANVRDRLKK
jgi:hypothetical protein